MRQGALLRFALGPAHSVGSDQFVYWIATNNKRKVAPNVFVRLDVPEADVYEMLNIIEKHAAELAATDPTFSQIAKDMKGFQKRGVESSIDLVPIHPGLAKWMREKGVWDSKWDSKIAKS